MILNQSETPTAIDTEESRFIALAVSGANIFLTGMAGTGKSTLLRHFIESSVRRIDVTAPTGVAALNVNGMTIHRFCGMMLGPKNGESNEAYFATLRRDPRRSILNGFNRVKRCEVLVIDEISMLPGRQLEFIEYLFRTLRGNERPFGGCQVIVVGDFLQLPPVRIDERFAYDWAFLSPAWEAGQFQKVILNTVRRQDEPKFVKALGEFRLGRVWGDSAKLFQSRIHSFPPSRLTRLFTHNIQVDKWNNFQLDGLEGDPTVFEATTSGPEQQVAFLTKNLLTPTTLTLKPGAQVMFTVNRSEPGNNRPLYVNGQSGVVLECRRDCLWVQPKHGGDPINVEPFTWKFSNEEDCGQVTQYPLRLAWAMTIHKSQGLTLEEAYLDIRAAREPGQAYVAVSRVRTLGGLFFKGWFKGLCVSNEAINFYKGE